MSAGGCESRIAIAAAPCGPKAALIDNRSRCFEGELVTSPFLPRPMQVAHAGPGCLRLVPSSQPARSSSSRMVGASYAHGDTASRARRRIDGSCAKSQRPVIPVRPVDQSTTSHAAVARERLRREPARCRRCRLAQTYRANECGRKRHPSVDGHARRCMLRDHRQPVSLRHPAQS